MEMPDFNRLRVFYHVFERGSVVGASKALHVTQPAVSQSLKKLEQELGVPLFTRLHKRLVPTRAGERLFEVVEPFVVALRGCVESLHHGRGVPSGCLRIGAPVEFGQSVLPRVFGGFKAQHAEVRFELELGHPTVLLPLLESGTLDVAFVDTFARRVEGASDLSIFDVRPIFEEELALICSSAYLQRQLAGEVTLERLHQADYIAYARHTPSLKGWFGHHYDTRAIKPRVVMTVESVRAAIHGVEHHLGLAVVPSHLVSASLQSGALHVVQTGRGPLVNVISRLLLQDKIPTLAERLFLSYCDVELAPGAEPS